MKPKTVTLSSYVSLFLLLYILMCLAVLFTFLTLRWQQEKADVRRESEITSSLIKQNINNQIKLIEEQLSGFRVQSKTICISYLKYGLDAISHNDEVRKKIQSILDGIIQWGEKPRRFALIQNDGRAILAFEGVVEVHVTKLKNVVVPINKELLAAAAGSFAPGYELISGDYGLLVKCLFPLGPIGAKDDFFYLHVESKVDDAYIKQANWSQKRIRYEVADRSRLAAFNSSTLLASELLGADSVILASDISRVQILSYFRKSDIIVMACFLFFSSALFCLARRMTVAFSMALMTLKNRLAVLLKGEDIEKISELTSISEINSIIDSYNQTVDLLDEYRDKLKQMYHLASIGQTTAMVAHDVRRPLAGMKALLASLPFIKDDPEQVAKMAAGVDRSISQTNAMLSDILEFSKDATSLNLAEHDPQGVIVSALGDALRNHPGASVKISYDLKHGHMLRIDGARIIRVLTNIIDNALDAMTSKETGNAGGSLSMGSYETENDGRKFIGLVLADSGPGIPEEMLAKIFDPFFTHGKKGGTGLGLAICRRIISLHGGTIAVRNREAVRGAEFVIELPAGESQATINERELIFDSAELKAFREEEKVRPDYGDTANTVEFMRINKARGRPSYLLLVDDEPLFRESVRSLLAGVSQVRDHVKVVEADSAEVALKLFDAREFDYVIADIDMGKMRMDGYEFARIVLDRYKDTHVLIHSNKRREEMDKGIRQISSGKFMGFLPKPMHASELLQFLACKSFEVAPQQTAAVSAKKSVLLVNDDADFRMGFKFQIREAGDVRLLEAGSVKDALSILDSNGVDIILSDVNLGEGEPDGYELVKRVRENGNTKSLIYMVSGYSRESEEPKALALGANGFCQLPLEDGILKKIIEDG